MRDAAAVDPHVEPLAERVDHRGANAVQATGRRVRAAAELATRVELGHDDLDAAQARLGLDVHGDAAAAVAHLHGVVGVEDDLDLRAVPAERLVDRVVDDFPQAVHQPARVRGADVHAGALAHRLEPLEDGEVAGGVVFGGHAVSLCGRCDAIRPPRRRCGRPVRLSPATQRSLSPTGQRPPLAFGPRSACIAMLSVFTKKPRSS